MQIAPDLDPRSALPIYRQIHDYIADLVHCGKLGKGDRLPATRELAGSLGLNRATVAAAYELLEAEGLVASHVGRGSFVAGPGEARPALDWAALLGAPGAEPPPPNPEGGISFAASRPGQDLFPLEDVRATCGEVMGQPDLPAILQLGSPAGYEPLRRRLLDTARERGEAGPGDGILVTNGCQQGLDLLGARAAAARRHRGGGRPDLSGAEESLREHGRQGRRGARRHCRNGRGGAAARGGSGAGPAGGGYLEFSEPHRRHAAPGCPPRNSARCLGSRRGAGGERHLRGAALFRRGPAGTEGTRPVRQYRTAAQLFQSGVSRPAGGMGHRAGPARRAPGGSQAACGPAHGPVLTSAAAAVSRCRAPGCASAARARGRLSAAGRDARRLRAVPAAGHPLHAARRAA